MPDIFVSKKEPVNQKVSKTTSTISQPSQKISKHRLPGHTHNPLTAYCYLPDSVDFETKDSKEKVILLLRRHFVTNIGWIIVLIIMILAPLVLRYFPLISFFPGTYQLIAILGWYLLTSAYFLESFLTWFFNIYIVTDERVVDVDFYNLIYKQVSDANIDKIQDVSYNMGGVGRTFFNFGNVFIQTAAEVNNFDFLAVPNPDKVAKIIEDMITKADK